MSEIIAQIDDEIRQAQSDCAKCWMDLPINMPVVKPAAFKATLRPYAQRYRSLIKLKTRIEIELRQDGLV